MAADYTPEEVRNLPREEQFAWSQRMSDRLKSETEAAVAENNRRREAEAAAAAAPSVAEQAMAAGTIGAGNALNRGLSASAQTLGSLPTDFEAANVMGVGGRLGQTLDQGFNLEADQGYQFRKQQGEEAIARARAAAGGRFGGAALKEIAQYNSGLAAQEANAAFGRYATTAGLAAQDDAGQRQLGLNQATRQDAAARFGIGNQIGLGTLYAGQQYGTGRALAQNQIGLGGTLAGLGARDAYGANANDMAMLNANFGILDDQTNIAGQTEAVLSNEMGKHSDRFMQLGGSSGGAGGVSGADSASFG